MAFGQGFLMKTLNPTLDARSSADAQVPIFLAEISFWGGAAVRLADTDCDVVFDGNVYDARPFSVSGALGAVDGTAVQSGSISIANHDLAFSVLCAANDPRGAYLKVFRVFLGDDLTAVSQDPFIVGAKIVDYRVDETAVQMSFADMASLFKLSLPRRWHNRTCSWIFKGTECGYSGSANFCAESPNHQQNGPHEYTDAACKALDNYDNFGGFLFVFPSRK